MSFLDYVELNPKIDMTKGKNYPFVEMASVSSYFRSPEKVEKKPFDTGVRFQDGDTVIARITPCLQNGKRFYCQKVGTGFGSTEFLVFRPKNSFVDSKFLYYYMQTNFIKQSMINSMTGATGRQRVNNDVFNDLNVTFPEIEEQKKIGEILSSYDDLIENNQKQIKLLEEAAQRLYKEWFVDLRFPGYETTTIIDGVPEGWAFKEIESQITLYSGFAFKSADFCDDGQYRIITIKNVKDGQFIPDDTNKMKEIPSQMPNHCKLNDGDILLSLTGNVGRVCLVFGEGFLLNQRVAKLQSDHPGFAYCLFRSKDMFDTMSNLANGAAQQNLSPVRTGKTKVLFPSVEIQQSFETIVFPMLKHIVSLNKEISTAVIARDSLLPKLMNGEIKV